MSASSDGSGAAEATPVVLSWSGGKDSAMALHALRADPSYVVVGLLTTVSQAYDRVVMQGVRRELVERQAHSLGLDLDVVRLPPQPSNAVYEAHMAGALARWRDRGVEHVGFGDLFLEDIREYRLAQVEGAGMTAVFPVWTGQDGTPGFVQRLLVLGFRALVVCLDPARLPADFAGREIDAAFLADLPDGVDPAGENGEFHTFVYDGPGFAAPLTVRHGEDVTRNGFLYRDLQLL